MADTDNTILRLEGIGIPPWSARGISENLEPIDESIDIVRSVNGEAINFGKDQFQKYKWAIGATDQSSPSCAGVWAGRIIQVDCITEHCYPTTAGLPAGVVIVPGSDRTEGDFSFYRPRLQIMLKNGPGIATDEWPADIKWTMGGEQV